MQLLLLVATFLLLYTELLLNHNELMEFVSDNGSDGQGSEPQESVNIGTGTKTAFRQLRHSSTGSTSRHLSRVSLCQQRGLHGGRSWSFGTSAPEEAKEMSFAAACCGYSIFLSANDSYPSGICQIGLFAVMNNGYIYYIYIK